MNGLLLDLDREVAKWVYMTYNLYPLPVDKAVGIVSPTGTLVGAFLFQNYNGVNVELSYYGPGTVTPSVVRAIAKITVSAFNAARLTVVTSKRNKRLIRGLLKLGFKLEGVQRCFYGHEDNTRNVGVRLAAFRDRLDQVAGKSTDGDRRLSSSAS